MGSIIQSVGTRRWTSQAPSNSRQKQCKRCRAPPLFLDGSKSDRHDLFLLQEYVEGVHLRVVVLGNRVLYSVKNLIAPGEFRANARYNGGVERFPLLDTEQQQMVAVARGIGLDYVGLDVV